MRGDQVPAWLTEAAHDALDDQTQAHMTSAAESAEDADWAHEQIEAHQQGKK